MVRLGYRCEQCDIVTNITTECEWVSDNNTKHNRKYICSECQLNIRKNIDSRIKETGNEKKVLLKDKK